MPQSKTKGPLSINPTPFKPSHLSIPPSPCSPRTPLTPFRPFSKPTASLHTAIYNSQTESDAPSPPLSWVWQCHQCHRSYHLGVTRRCLEDGHQFCSGTTTVKAWRKPVQQRRTRRHKACASEFDYGGWKAWGRWRRGGARNQVAHSLQNGRSPQQREGPVLKNDCWNACDYPSECRWGKKFGIHTPTSNSSTFPILEICSAPVHPEDAPKSPEEGVLKPENVKTVGLEQDKTDFWGALLASAKRRKSSPPSSPLASVAEEEEKDAESATDSDGDVIMSSPSSSSDSSPETSPTAPAPATVTSAAMDMLKDLMSRKTARREKKSMFGSNTEHKYAAGVPVLTVPEPVLKLKADEQVFLNEGEAFSEGFEPLERVRSRKDLSVLGTVGGL
jgi:hypothetical protein